MALYAKLALRNVFRNRRRTLITLAAMGFGAAAIIVFGGFVHSIYYGVRESTIRSQVGHIQFYRKGYSEKGNLAPFDYLIADYPTLRDELRRLPHVKTVTARLCLSGLVSTGDTTTAFVGSGVVPEGEMDLSALAVIVDGKELATRDPRGVTLGVGLARAFGVKPGDDLTLLTTSKAGAINALAVKVRGVWESGEKAYDDRFLRIGLPEVQRVLDLEHGEVQSVVLLLDRTENTAAVRDRLERLIRERGLDLELKTWEDLALRYHQVRELFGRIFGVLTLIVSIMVVFGITNTMTMAIFERTREIGTVMALGTRRRGVVSMFVLEGFVLGVLGAIAGVVLGGALAKAISAVGIQLPPPPGSTRGFMVQIFVVPAVLAQAFELSIVAATLASLYPAWRAARLNVVEALRHVEFHFNGGHDMAPKPPTLGAARETRAAPRSRASLEMAPQPPNARGAPAKPWRPSIPRAGRSGSGCSSLSCSASRRARARTRPRTSSPRPTGFGGRPTASCGRSTSPARRRRRHHRWTASRCSSRAAGGCSSGSWRRRAVSAARCSRSGATSGSTCRTPANPCASRCRSGWSVRSPTAILRAPTMPATTTPP